MRPGARDHMRIVMDVTTSSQMMSDSLIGEVSREMSIHVSRGAAADILHTYTRPIVRAISHEIDE